MRTWSRSLHTVYHAFISDRAGELMELEAGHRRHAGIENAIRDLKYGVGLNHLPSGRFAANAAWLAVQVIAHNLARWTARLGLGEGIVTTRTLRRRYFALAGRLTHFYEGRSFRKADVAAFSGYGAPFKPLVMSGRGACAKLLSALSVGCSEPGA